MSKMLATVAFDIEIIIQRFKDSWLIIGKEISKI